MFINEVANGAELSSIIINELRDMYGVKYRKDKKLKDQNVIFFFVNWCFFFLNLEAKNDVLFFLIRMLAFDGYSVCR